MNSHNDITFQYIAKSNERGLKENKLRNTVIDVLTTLRDYTAVIHLYKKINDRHPGTSRSEISTTLKKLTVNGIIERKRIEKNNHFVYKLRSLKAIENTEKYVDVRMMNLNVY